MKMKNFPITSIFVILTAKSVLSIPPRTGKFGGFRNEGFNDFNERLDSYGLPATTSTTAAPSGPYPPSGWKPQGDLLLVPGETHSSQQNNNYGGTPPPPPSNSYGAVTTTETTTTTEVNPEPESSEVDAQIGNLNDDSGQYYVISNNGKLHKVRYSGRQRRGKQYEAQVQYEELDPIQAPIYSYQNYPLQLF